VVQARAGRRFGVGVSATTGAADPAAHAPLALTGELAGALPLATASGHSPTLSPVVADIFACASCVRRLTCDGLLAMDRADDLRDFSVISDRIERAA
jgi:hypothetical protein